MTPYLPAPFPSPVPTGHDPLAAVSDVISIEESSIRLMDSTGAYRTLARGDLQAGFAPTVGSRVTLRASKPVGFLKSLFGAKPTVQLAPLQADDQELAFANRWLASLRAAGLDVEGDLEALLVARLRTAPFGSLKLPPLRRILRAELDRALGAVPMTADLGRSRTEVSAVLSTLGAQAIEDGWQPTATGLAAVVELASRADQQLAAAGSPIRLVACEREPVDNRDPHTSDRDDEIEQPTWLPLVPAVARQLETAGVLRVHRDAQLEPSAVQRDPRSLRLGAAASGPPQAAVITLGAASRPPAPEPTPAATAPHWQLVTPCRARIESFVAMDAVGKLVTETGVTVGFGRSACLGFEPVPGLEVHLIEAAPHPSGRGYRAKGVNLTGALEVDRLTAAEEKSRVGLALRHEEERLREDFGLSRHLYWVQLLKLEPSRREQLATRLMEMKRNGHFFDDLFEDLVIIDPRVFHPFLSELSSEVEPESLAFVEAPFAAVASHAEALIGLSATRLRDPPKIGSVGTARELDRASRAPANVLATALLTLGRCGAPEAVQAIELWLATTAMSPDEVNDLLIVAGWQVHEHRLHRVASGPAFRRVADPAGDLELFGPLEATCGTCDQPLLNLLRRPGQLLLATCPRCLAFGIESYDLHLAADGSTTTLSAKHAPDSQPMRTWKELPQARRTRLEPAPIAIPPHVSVTEHIGRVGGMPSWILYAVSRITCAQCRRPMHFAAQFEDPVPDRETWAGGDAGLIYAFECRACSVVSTVLQFES